MELDRFLSADDLRRAAHVLRKLVNHDISRWALTGGFAIELQILRRGGRSCVRPLHDIDFLVESFEDVPETLGGEFLFRHVHPYDRPGKTLLQFVDQATAVRVDVFRAYGREMDRADVAQLAGLPVRMVSLTDLVVRHARLTWDLVGGNQVSPKYARDFLRMLELVNMDEVETVWLEHRKPHSPEGFAEAVRELRRTIELRQNLLVPPIYSTDTQACARCHSDTAFPLADTGRIVELLGYC